MRLRLEDDGMCFACGDHNPHGFKIKFDDSEPGTLKTSVVFSKIHQGFKDIVHGGFVALLMDEVMVNLVWKSAIPAVTGELSVRFKEPVKVGEEIRFEARLDCHKGKLLYLSATATNSREVVVATASAKCVKMPQKQPS